MAPRALADDLVERVGLHHRVHDHELQVRQRRAERDLDELAQVGAGRRARRQHPRSGVNADLVARRRADHRLQHGCIHRDPDDPARLRASVDQRARRIAGRGTAGPRDRRGLHDRRQIVGESRRRARLGLQRARPLVERGEPPLVRGRPRVPGARRPHAREDAELHDRIDLELAREHAVGQVELGARAAGLRPERSHRHVDRHPVESALAEAARELVEYRRHPGGLPESREDAREAEQRLGRGVVECRQPRVLTARVGPRARGLGAAGQRQPREARLARGQLLHALLEPRRVTTRLPVEGAAELEGHGCGARHAQVVVGVDPEPVARESRVDHPRHRLGERGGLHLGERGSDRACDAVRDVLRDQALPLDLAVDRATIIAIRDGAQIRDASRRHEQRGDGEHVDPGSRRGHDGGQHSALRWNRRHADGRCPGGSVRCARHGAVAHRGPDVQRA